MPRARPTNTSGRLFVVHPMLHTSGFGNQVGMLLQHVAIARLSGRALVLPAIHQPAEHRQQGEPAEESEIAVDAVFNLSSLSVDDAPVLAARQLGSAVALGGSQHLTFSTVAAGASPVPLLMRPAPLPTTLAAVELLRRPDRCADGREDGSPSHDCSAIGYCHLVSCRTRTKRACRHRRRGGGCSRAMQRLPNNYLFAHRLPALLCGQLDSGDAAVDGATRRGLRSLWRHEYLALGTTPPSPPPPSPPPPSPPPSFLLPLHRRDSAAAARRGGARPRRAHRGGARRGLRRRARAAARPRRAGPWLQGPQPLPAARCAPPPRAAAARGAARGRRRRGSRGSRLAAAAAAA